MSPLNEIDNTDNEISSDELIAKGRRDLICLEIHNAVDSFQKACQLIAAKKGDFHYDLANPNLLYGTALLELARTENQILTEVGGATDENSSDDDKETNAVNDTDINNENGSCDANDNDDTDTLSHELQEVEETNTEKDDKNKELINESEDIEDISTLQLAWEVIEVAKALFQQHEDDVNKLKVADCLEKLAEISCEKEDHEQAIVDLLESLEIRQSIAKDNERLIAETHFQLGVTYSLCNNQHSAETSFALSLDCLNKHKAKLESTIISSARITDVEKADANRLELQLKEVSQLIREVEERRNELIETNASSSLKENNCSKKTDPSEPVADITHLIKKKRPVEQNIEENKKPRLEID